jgi:RHS repeat-associated protein
LGGRGAKGGYPYQFFYYSAFGESLVQQDAFTGNFSTPYRFNAKELDPETGNYYYGARYYNPQTSIWFGVDPLAHKYPHVTPYNFVEGNPISLIDPDGNGPIDPRTWKRRRITGIARISVILTTFSPPSDKWYAYDSDLDYYAYLLRLSSSQSEGAPIQRIMGLVAPSRKEHIFEEGHGYVDRNGDYQTSLYSFTYNVGGASAYQSAATKGNYDYKIIPGLSNSRFEIYSVTDGIITRIESFEKNDNGKYEKKKIKHFNIEMSEEIDFIYTPEGIIEQRSTSVQVTETIINKETNIVKTKVYEHENVWTTSIIK